MKLAYMCLHNIEQVAQFLSQQIYYNEFVIYTDKSINKQNVRLRRKKTPSTQKE